MKKALYFGVLTILLLPLTSFAAFDTSLKYGSSGPAVKEMQEFLISQGAYSGPITGNFYALTLAGVKAFQAKESINPVSGYWGPLTRAKASAMIDLAASDADEQAETGTGAAPVVIVPNDPYKEKISELSKQYDEMQPAIKDCFGQVGRTAVVCNLQIQQASNIQDEISGLIQLENLLPIYNNPIYNTSMPKTDLCEYNIQPKIDGPVYLTPVNQNTNLTYYNVKLPVVVTSNCDLSDKIIETTIFNLKDNSQYNKIPVKVSLVGGLVKIAGGWSAQVANLKNDSNFISTIDYSMSFNSNEPGEYKFLFKIEGTVVPITVVLA